MAARDVALEVLRRVSTQRAFASSALRSVLSGRPVSAADRGLATELVYGVLRRRGHLDRAVARAAGRRFKDVDPKLHDVLRVGAYQIIFLDRVPAHAAVDAAVEQAKRRRAGKGAGFVNAVLRKLAATPLDQRLPPPPAMAVDPVAHVAAVGGLPEKLARRLVEDLGAQEAAAFAVASLEAAPLTLRVNRLRDTVDAVAAEVGGTPGAVPWSVRLRQAGDFGSPPWVDDADPAGAAADPKQGARRSGPQLPAELLAVRDGRATPQDEASMRVVTLLDPQPGEQILDVCAAPGGKTTHAAEAMRDQGRVVAHDRLPSRLRRVEASAARLGLHAVEIAEVLPLETEPFDRVLVDAPCSGLGTLRRHPEIRWRLTDEDVAELTQTQSAVLAEGAKRVRPGGILVYAVCTVTRAEGADHLAEVSKDFEVQDVLRTGPHQPGAPDGFFAARLRRRDT